MIGLSTEVMGRPRYKIKDAERTKHKIDHERVVEAGIRLEGPPARAAGSIQDALSTACRSPSARRPS